MPTPWPGASAHLARDPRLAPIVQAAGEPALSLARDRFRSLARAILHQQLAGAAAATIVRRVEEANGGRFPNPAQLAAMPPARLRAAGVSPQKLRYLKDLAGAVEERRLDLRRVARMEDEEVIAALTEVKGVGRWTAEMFLIFSLGRPDVWPVGDYGVQKGVQRVHGMRSLPSPARMAKVAEPWRPYRSAAAWYMWRSLDIATPGVGGAKA